MRSTNLLLNWLALTCAFLVAIPLILIGGIWHLLKRLEKEVYKP